MLIIWENRIILTVITIMALHLIMAPIVVILMAMLMVSYPRILVIIILKIMTRNYKKCITNTAVC